MSRAAQSSRLNRENLYRLVSRKGNPRLASLNSILTALGLRVVFEAALLTFPRIAIEDAFVANNFLFLIATVVIVN